MPSVSAAWCVSGRGGVGDVMEMAGNGCVVSVVCVVGREVGRVVAVGTTVASKGRGPVQVAGRGGM